MIFQAEKARLEVARIEKEKKMAQEEAKRAEEAERKKAALAALNVKQGPKTGSSLSLGMVHTGHVMDERTS